MPIALPRGDRVGQWDPRHALSSFSSPCPLYSGHLLKLGSNDRWQSRLFTFDGAVLTCVGKRPRTPPIATYDPHVSSPFVSASCHPQPYNPNTKWFLNLSSITDIRLLPSSRTYRCFPYTDTSRSLVIQTADGRTLTLRAKKDLELERWYFVLAKIWSYQQLLLHPEAREAAIGLGKDEDPDQPQSQHLQQQHQLLHHTIHPQHQHGVQHGHNHHHRHSPNHHRSHHNHRHRHHAPTAASLLPAHQQSLHLYSKYLQRQQYQHDPQEYQPAQPRSPQQQQQSQRNARILHQQQQSPPPHTISKARESFLRYQLPLPRVSAFLPQGFDWALQRHDEDDEDDEDDEEEDDEDDDDDDDEEDNIRVFLTTSFQDSPHISGDSKMNHHPGSSNANDIKNESIARQNGSWSQERDSIPTTDLLNSSISSPGIFLNQPIVWPAAGTMAPAKAAAIDMWRRSLLSPLLMDEASSLLSDDDDSDDDSGPHHALHGGQIPELNTAITNDLSNDFAVRDQLNNTDERGPISPQSAQSRSRWYSHKEHYTRPHLALEDCLASSSSSASSSGDHQCGPFVPDHRRHFQASQQPYLQPSGHIEDNMLPGMVHHNRHISLGGLEIVTSGLGIHPHEQPQQHNMHRIAVDEEDDVPAPEPLHAMRFQQRWQKTQLSSDDETGTNRDSLMAFTNTADLTRSSFGTFPNRDSSLNLSNNNQLLSADPSVSSKKVPLPPAISAATTRPPPNKQAKKGLLTGILKRPSLPDLGSAVLAAAVAGLGGAFSSETKKRTATFVTESTVVPQPQQWTASPSTPSSSQPGSTHHLPLYDPSYEFPVPHTETILPAPVLTSDHRHQRHFEDVGPLSMPNPASTMTLELNKGPFGLPMPRLSVASPTASVSAQLSPPARPPRRHPLDIRFLRKPSLAVQSGRSAASASSDQAFESRLAPLAVAPALSWTGPLSSVKAEDPLSTHESPVVVRAMLPRPPQDIPRRRSSEPAVAFLGLGLDLGEDSFGEDITRDLELTSQQSYTPPPPPAIPFISSEFRISPFDVVPGTPVEAFYDLARDQFESPRQTAKGKATETAMTESEKTEDWQPRPPSHYQEQEQQQQLNELSPDKGGPDQDPVFVPLRRSSSSTSCSKNDVLDFNEDIDSVSDASAKDDYFSYF